jgi:hypothetical protein
LKGLSSDKRTAGSAFKFSGAGSLPVSKGSWTRCSVTGEPISLIGSSDWIALENPRHSFEVRFPGADTFCLTCCAIMAAYNQNHMRYEVVFDAANKLQLGSAQVVTGKPSEGYVFAGNSTILTAVGNYRRQFKTSEAAKIPRFVSCTRCGRLHKLPRQSR